MVVEVDLGELDIFRKLGLSRRRVPCPEARSSSRARWSPRLGADRLESAEGPPGMGAWLIPQTAPPQQFAEREHGPSALTTGDSRR